MTVPFVVFSLEQTGLRLSCASHSLSIAGVPVTSGRILFESDANVGTSCLEPFFLSSARSFSAMSPLCGSHFLGPCPEVSFTLLVLRSRTVRFLVFAVLLDAGPACITVRPLPPVPAPQ